MEISNIHEAKSQLSKLVEMALAGEDVIIARAGTPVVRLVPFRKDEKPRVGGQLRGKIKIADDFDDFDEELERMFYGEDKEP